MCKPLLPKAEDLLPYLHQIDNNRWYTNSGPLLKQFEGRIGKMMNCHAVAVSSCTSGMIACLWAQGGSRRVNVPGWTFVATANAVKMSTNAPVFQDVDPVTWKINRWDERGYPGILVSPFGAPVYDLPLPKPLLIDAAAAFDVYAAGISRVDEVPVVISTHATKCFSTGEGGLVLTTDEHLANDVREIINHGIDLDREVPIPGFNGKMSEYHAAVGLASLDTWKITRSIWAYTKTQYMKAFKEYDNTVFNPAWVGPSFCIDMKKDVTPVIEKLKQKGITARKMCGVHKYKAYDDFPRSPLPVTERLSEQVLFLPFWIDATSKEIDSIRDAVG